MKAIMTNLSNFTPFIFHFNPENITNHKKSEWSKSKNIGGASKKNFFSGFDNRELSFKIKVIDQKSPMGVRSAEEWFSQLQEPDPGIIGIAGSFFGNENYPPPQVLFQFGISTIPLVWDVMDVVINGSNFKGDDFEAFGFAEYAEIDITLELDTDNIFNKANQIAKKVSMISGSIASVYKEFRSETDGDRKELVEFL